MSGTPKPWPIEKSSDGKRYFVDGWIEIDNDDVPKDNRALAKRIANLPVIERENQELREALELAYKHIPPKAVDLQLRAEVERLKRDNEHQKRQHASAEHDVNQLSEQLTQWQKCAERLAARLMGYSSQFDEGDKEALAEYERLRGGGQNGQKAPDPKETSASEVVSKDDVSTTDGVPTDTDSLTVQSEQKGPRISGEKMVLPYAIQGQNHNGTWMTISQLSDLSGIEAKLAEKESEYPKSKFRVVRLHAEVIDEGREA